MFPLFFFIELLILKVFINDYFGVNFEGDEKKN